ncbi:hypothetical protein Zmor_005150 [Zophobas morio]|uniref:Caspase-1 n=3 Tax=Zophobas morio TaxID=2755281 RepID=A0AA38MLP7_9CUCU|nr:hypothetical protein Zmor_005150 [Zophobas morio]
MDHSKRGIAVIFNHVDFSHPECSRREGSDKDRDDLVEMFHDLNFNVSVHNDLTAHDIASELIKVSRMDHTDSDCLAIVVMSHGNNGKLYARDREYPTRTIWEYFTANNCPTLAGKPKLLFVQACRGSCLHSAATLHYQTGGVEEDSSSVDAYYSIPVMADILVMYSTVEGYYSYRDPGKGAYFIKSLVKEMKQYHKTKDLLTILTFVNREVAVDFTSYEPGSPEQCGHKQICSIVSMLTRLVYFNKRI